jgi:hypothetical protein
MVAVRSGRSASATAMDVVPPSRMTVERVAVRLQGAQRPVHHLGGRHDERQDRAVE